MVCFAALVLERSLIDPEGAASALSGMDFQLLKLLVEHPGEVLDRSRLAEVTRGRDLGPLARSLDVQVSRLRQRLRAGRRLAGGGGGRALLQREGVRGRGPVGIRAGAVRLRLQHRQPQQEEYHPEYS
jgi:hypothetical protein